MCQTSGTATQELFNPRQQHQKLVDRNVMKNICLSLFVCKPDSLKFYFGHNHCKCIDRTNNKSEFSLSPDIVPTGIEYES